MKKIFHSITIYYMLTVMILLSCTSPQAYASTNLPPSYSASSAVSLSSQHFLAPVFFTQSIESTSKMGWALVDPILSNQPSSFIGVFFQLIIGAIMLVVDLVIVLVSFIGSLLAAIIPILKFVLETVIQVIKFIVHAIVWIFKTIFQILKYLFNLVIKLIQWTFKIIATVLKYIWSIICSIAKWTVRTLTPTIKNICNWLYKGLKYSFNWCKKTFKTIFKTKNVTVRSRAALKTKNLSNSTTKSKVKTTSSQQNTYTKTQGSINRATPSTPKSYFKTCVKKQVAGRRVYQHNDIFDPHYKDAKGQTNITRMKKGLAPIGKDGKPINLHHLRQKDNGAIVEMPAEMHTTHTKELHKFKTESEINRQAFNAWRKKYWMKRATDFE